MVKGKPYLEHSQTGAGGTYLHEGARLGDQVVDGVEWDPHHRGEGEAESQALRPGGVAVVAQLDRLERGDVEDKDTEHDERRKVLPAEEPEDVGLVARHLLHTVTEPKQGWKCFPMLIHLCVPKNHPMAMVWKKVTQRRARPEQE